MCLLNNGADQSEPRVNARRISFCAYSGDTSLETKGTLETKGRLEWQRDAGSSMEHCKNDMSNFEAALNHAAEESVESDKFSVCSNNIPTVNADSIDDLLKDLLMFSTLPMKVSEPERSFRSEDFPDPQLYSRTRFSKILPRKLLTSII